MSLGENRFCVNCVAVLCMGLGVCECFLNVVLSPYPTVAFMVGPPWPHVFQ